VVRMSSFPLERIPFMWEFYLLLSGRKMKVRMHLLYLLLFWGGYWGFNLGPHAC
jgi:hypothetical protein